MLSFRDSPASELGPWHRASEVLAATSRSRERETLGRFRTASTPVWTLRPAARGASLIFAVRDKVHVITRRQFSEDIRRHFVGAVVAADGALIRAAGYVFVYESFDEKFVRRPELRTRIFNCGESGLIVNILPPGTVLDNVAYKITDENRLVATNGCDFRLDINEFSDRR